MVTELRKCDENLESSIERRIRGLSEVRTSYERAEVTRMKRANEGSHKGNHIEKKKRPVHSKSCPAWTVQVLDLLVVLMMPHHFLLFWRLFLLSPVSLWVFFVSLLEVVISCFLARFSTGTSCVGMPCMRIPCMSETSSLFLSLSSSSSSFLTAMRDRLAF